MGEFTAPLYHTCVVFASQLPTGVLLPWVVALADRFASSPLEGQSFGGKLKSHTIMSPSMAGAIF